jgi:predicted nucleic acid-binding protein
LRIFVDTSVWSLALRRDRPPRVPEVHFLEGALDIGEELFTTGLVLQELLQGFLGAKARGRILQAFAALPLLVPDREAHVAAADLRSACRRRGIQVETIDALYAQLCLQNELTMLTTDDDFRQIARVRPLVVWRA